MTKIYGNSKRIHITLPEDLYYEFDEICQLRYSTVSGTIRGLVEQFVERQNSKPEDDNYL